MSNFEVKNSKVKVTKMHKSFSCISSCKVDRFTANHH